MIGFPFFIKASKGGGGRGMVVVQNADELESSIKKAKTEADKSFDNDNLFYKCFLTHLRFFLPIRCYHLCLLATQ